MNGYFYVIGGANYEKNESLIIDLDIIKETKKDNPSILYIPIAVNDDLNKINLFKTYYEKLGTKVEVLYSYNQELKIEEIKKMISEADVIYLAGGLTYRLYNFAIKYNLQEMLLNAFYSGKIIAGVSAGAILMFDYGYGDKDAYTFNLETVNHKMTNGIGILNGVFCPHYQNSGMTSFHSVIKNYDKNGYAVENGASLKIKNNSFEVIKNKHSNAFLLDKNENHKLVYLKTNQKYSL
jgi:dipeptidase E